MPLHPPLPVGLPFNRGFPPRKRNQFTMNGVAAVAAVCPGLPIPSRPVITGLHKAVEPLPGHEAAPTFEQ
jgi:hypothetical protein